ncbi:MAG: hypothetical protein QM831_35515 [Kofleriaceae bacterium]
MLAHDQAADSHHPAVGPAHEKDDSNVKELVARTSGDPDKLAHVIKTQPHQRQAIVKQAQEMFGNAAVQRALADEKREDAAPKTESHDHSAAAHAGPAAKQRMAQQPTAHAARFDNGGPSTSYTGSASTSFTSGDVHINETVSCTIQNGDGPCNFDLSKDTLSVGNEHMQVDYKSARSVTGKGLRTTGAKVTVAHNSTQKSSAKVEDGYVGVEYETSYTVHGDKGWSATFTISAFVGVKPPKPHKHWWQKIPIVSVVTGAVISAIVAAGATIIATSPEWGPVVVLAL